MCAVVIDCDYLDYLVIVSLLFSNKTDVIFDDLPMKSTIVTEFNLFCNEEYKAKHYLKND